MGAAFTLVWDLVVEGSAGVWLSWIPAPALRGLTLGCYVDPTRCCVC